MKKIHQLIIPILSGIAVFILVLSSCNKMDDIQRKYAEKTEQVYLGRVDSLVSVPGISRAKLVWYINSDPKIDRTIIYWNMRKDSIVKEFKRATAGLQKDSVIINNLSEGTTLIELRNVNKDGETSLYTSVSATVWGPIFASGLRARKINELNFDYFQSAYDLTLSATTDGDSVVYSEILYKNAHNEQIKVQVARDSNKIKLEDFPDGGEFRFRTVFFSPKGIDTIYNEYAVFKAPSAVISRGTKIAFTGDMANKYFDRNGETFYEWNTAGDLIVHTLGAGGELTPVKTYPLLAPRTTYRDFFYYDEDRFIGISTANEVSMSQIEDDHLTVLASAFGTGFSFARFIPAKGYFYSMTAGSGAMLTWFARSNASWGSPNGVSVGTGYDIYDPLVLFNRKTLLGVDAEGYLWSFPTSVSGAILSKSRIGFGWERFKKIVSVGTTLYGMEDNGDFYVFENFDTDKIWVVN